MRVSGSRDLTVAVTLAGCVALPVGLLAVSSPSSAAALPAAVQRAVPAAAVPAAASACTPASLAVRAGATLMVGLPGVTSVTDPMVRSVTEVGVSGIFLAGSNVRSAEQVRRLVTGLRASSSRPIIVSTDAESGRVSVLRAVIGGGPSPRRLARQDTPAEVTAFAADLGRRLKDLGIDLDLAPVLDLDDGAYEGIIGDRSFGTDPERVARYATAFSNGLKEAGVASAVKHFPGQGRSTADTHVRVATVDTTVPELAAHDLIPFQRLITGGAPVVVMNHLDYTALDAGLPASLSPKAYALLRSTGFVGAAITDSLGMAAVNSRWDFPEAAVRAVVAGADAAFATDGRQAARMRDALVAAVRSGRLPESRLDEAATRMAQLAGMDPTRLTCAPARR
ncbi:MAG: glycoside hydrolase family 3 N-terminal domain-containing protein [Mycobacteriales bacterium]